MKKLFKIFTLIIFILLVLGITTSQAALTVTKDTTPSEMLEELNKENGYLTGISAKIRKGNPYLYCRQRGQHISASAKYKFSNNNKQAVLYPNPDDSNSYAKAYILAAPGYGDNTSNGLRQYAWWYILGPNENDEGEKGEDGNNALLEIAEEYQIYKKEMEKETTVHIDEAKSNISENTLVYGPIKITYSYLGKTSGTYSDEWGGFDYAFFKGSEVITTGVELCALKDNTYTKVENNGINENYNKIRTSLYNDVNLYIKVDLSKITDVNSINLKIKENKADYKAKVYKIEGSYKATSSYQVFCILCEDKRDEAIEYTNDFTTEGLKRGDIIKFNGKYYKYCYKDQDQFATSNIPNYYETLRFGENEIKIEDENKQVDYDTMYWCVYYDKDNEEWVEKCSWLNKMVYFYSYDDWKIHIEEHYYYNEGTGEYVCCNTGFKGDAALEQHLKNEHLSIKYSYSFPVYEFYEFNGCDTGDCGKIIEKNKEYTSQKLFIVDSTHVEVSNEEKLDLEIPLSTSIEVTKTWNDYDNEYNLRPETLKFNIFRSTDKSNWEKLAENNDYKLTIEIKDESTWKIYITNLARRDENGNEYFFKVEEQELVCYQASYPNGKEPSFNEQNSVYYIDIENSLKKIDFTGYVWLDEEEGVKPATGPDGNYDEGEKKMAGMRVYLYYKNPQTGETSIIDETKTDANGYYEFKEKEIGYYYVKFEYDGINYEDTKEGGESKAFDVDREAFNSRFQTITYGKSNDGTTLNYNYSNNKSTLITTEENGQLKQEFIMNAASKEDLYTSAVNDINLGLVKRGTDIALSTDVSNAEVSINGQKTNYTYNSLANNVVIGNGQTSEKVSYNLNLYASDYYYRIRDYVSNDTFKEKDYINEGKPEGVTTGEELKVYVTYELNLQNQSTETTRINEVKYTFDEKYTFKQIVENGFTPTVSGKTITINLNGLYLGEGETKTIHLLFEVNNNNGLTLGNFSNSAEITSYSTDEGLIDVDSAPGNFMTDNKVEDDNDTAGGLTIKTEDAFIRKMTGKVFDKENQNVNDVIVQLIELKTVNNKVYEYIWQETVSGTGKGLRLNSAGTELEEYTYTKADGIYEFIGLIPGDYIVRFIYGDGTAYDMTGNVIKYNGQDYKSTKDAYYNAEWYNSSSYTEGASVARDNEARRLETMAYSVNIDASKGVLLKLLNNVTVETLNETEKEVLVSTYNNLYDPDITEVTTEVIKKLLKEQVLKNTWMCAETSKIKVAVDTQDITKTDDVIVVDGTANSYVKEIPNINLGLELRPATKIELKKYITGFKLMAANGQTLVNAYIDVGEYLNGSANANKVQGIKDNVIMLLDTVWQYEVAPTDINTIVDGASLEFEYTLVVKNTGDTDYLSKDLADAYNNNSTADYVALLTSKANEMKGYIRAGTYRTQIGNSVGDSYYVGGTGAGKVLTEVTNIRDYINNDLKLVAAGGDVAVDENAPHTYRILRDDYTMQQATINTILKTTRTTGKMENNGKDVIYKVTLGKNPISATGNLNFENYIAEVMSFTNAAGRRTMESTPGNAEIIDHEYRSGKSHEIDEADTARIQIGAATGEDGKTNYIIITAVIAGIVIIAAGAIVVKKYVIK